MMTKTKKILAPPRTAVLHVQTAKGSGNGQAGVSQTFVESIVQASEFEGKPGSHFTDLVEKAVSSQIIADSSIVVNEMDSEIDVPFPTGVRYYLDSMKINDAAPGTQPKVVKNQQLSVVTVYERQLYAGWFYDGIGELIRLSTNGKIRCSHCVIGIDNVLFDLVNVTHDGHTINELRRRHFMAPASWTIVNESYSTWTPQAFETNARWLEGTPWDIFNISCWALRELAESRPAVGPQLEEAAGTTPFTGERLSDQELESSRKALYSNSGAPDPMAWILNKRGKQPPTKQEAKYAASVPKCGCKYGTYLSPDGTVYNCNCKRMGLIDDVKHAFEINRAGHKKGFKPVRGQKVFLMKIRNRFFRVTGRSLKTRKQLHSAAPGAYGFWFSLLAVIITLMPHMRLNRSASRATGLTNRLFPLCALYNNPTLGILPGMANIQNSNKNKMGMGQRAKSIERVQSSLEKRHSCSLLLFLESILDCIIQVIVMLGYSLEPVLRVLCFMLFWSVTVLIFLRKVVYILLKFQVRFLRRHYLKWLLFVYGNGIFAAKIGAMLGIPFSINLVSIYTWVPILYLGKLIWHYIYVSIFMWVLNIYLSAYVFLAFLGFIVLCISCLGALFLDYIVEVYPTWLKIGQSLLNLYYDFIAATLIHLRKADEVYEILDEMIPFSFGRKLHSPVDSFKAFIPKYINNFKLPELTSELGLSWIEKVRNTAELAKEAVFMAETPEIREVNREVSVAPGPLGGTSVKIIAEVDRVSQVRNKDVRVIEANKIDVSPTLLQHEHYYIGPDQPIEKIFSEFTPYATKAAQVPGADPERIATGFNSPDFITGVYTILKPQYENSQLTSFSKVIKGLEMKYNYGAFAIEAGKAIKRSVMLRRPTKDFFKFMTGVVTDAAIYANVSMAFIKEEIRKVGKGCRSLCGTSIPGYFQANTWAYESGHRFVWDQVSPKNGMPLTGRYMSPLFKEFFTGNPDDVVIAGDFKCFDPSMPSELALTLAGVRKLGFQNHYQSETINKYIDIYYDSLMTTPIVTRKTGELIEKHRGTAMGHVCHSQDNSTGLVAYYYRLFLDANQHLEAGSKSAELFSQVFSLANFGDDNLIRWNKNDPLISQYHLKLDFDEWQDLATKYGIVLKKESYGNGCGTASDASEPISFLGKVPILDFKENNKYEYDRFLLGEKSPDVGVVHYKNFMDKFRMPYKSFSPSALLARASGYLLLTAHQPECFDEISNYIKGLVRRHPGLKKDPSYKISQLKYQDVLLRWYGDLTAHEEKLLAYVLGAERAARSSIPVYGLWDQLGLVFASFEETVRSLPQIPVGIGFNTPGSYLLTRSIKFQLIDFISFLCWFYQIPVFNLQPTLRRLNLNWINIRALVADIEWLELHHETNDSYEDHVIQKNNLRKWSTILRVYYMVSRALPSIPVLSIVDLLIKGLNGSLRFLSYLNFIGTARFLEVDEYEIFNPLYPFVWFVLEFMLVRVPRKFLLPSLTHTFQDVIDWVDWTVREFVHKKIGKILAFAKYSLNENLRQEVDKKLLYKQALDGIFHQGQENNKTHDFTGVQKETGKYNKNKNDDFAGVQKEISEIPLVEDGDFIGVQKETKKDIKLWEGSCTFVAPTGFGKSTDFIKFMSYQSNINRRVIVIVPTQMAAIGLVQYMTPQLPPNFVGGWYEGASKSPGYGLIYSTLDAFLARVATIAEDAVIVVDEAHVEMTGYKFLVENLTHMVSNKIIYMTATPTDWLETNTHVLNLFPSAEPNYQRFDHSLSYDEYLEHCAAVLEETHSKALFFVKTLADARALYRHCPAGSQILSSGNVQVDESKTFYIATSVADVGVTIPDVEVVYTSSVGFTVDCGLPKPTVSYCLSSQTIKQRCGRTGRTCPGIAHVYWDQEVHQGFNPTELLMSKELAFFNMHDVARARIPQVIRGIWAERQLDTTLSAVAEYKYEETTKAKGKEKVVYSEAKHEYITPIASKVSPVVADYQAACQVIYGSDNGEGSSKF